MPLTKVMGPDLTGTPLPPARPKTTFGCRVGTVPVDRSSFYKRGSKEEEPRLDTVESWLVTVGTLFPHEGRENSASE